MQDSVDVYLTAMQILTSTNEPNYAKDKPQLDKYKEAKEYDKIVNIAYSWPLYFVKWFDATEPSRGITQIAFGNKAVYLVNGSTSPKTVVASCSLSEFQLLKRTELQLNLLVNGQPFSLEANGFTIEQFLRIHVVDLQSVSNISVATRDHVVMDLNLLPFRKGDLIQIKEVDPAKGWFFGELAERSGWFSQENVQVLFAPVTNIMSWYIRDPIAFLFDGFGAEQSMQMYSERNASSPNKPGDLKKSGSIRKFIGSLTRSKGAEVSESMKGDDDRKKQLEKEKQLEAENEAKTEEQEDKLLLTATNKHTMLEWARTRFTYQGMPSDDDKNGSSAVDDDKSGGTMKGTLRRLKLSGGTMRREKSTSKPDNEINWGWKEVVNLLKYSKDPIKVPLHRNIESDQKLATDCFLAIMSYMGDFPSKNTDTQLVQHLIAAGLKKEILRDEIFCQMMKQVTNNKSTKPDSARRGWDLLQFASSCFPPSEAFMPYLSQWLQSQADDHKREFHEIADTCLKRVRKVKKIGPRKLPPATPEVLSIKTATPMSMRIYFPGDTSRMMMIDSVTIAADVMQKAGAKLEVKDEGEFGLFVISQTGSSVPILGDDYMLDVLNVAERMSQMTAQATMKKNQTKSDAQGPTFYVVYKKKLWLNRKITDSDMVVTIQYHQTVEMYLSGQVLSALELQPNFLSTAAELAAAQLAANPAFDRSLLTRDDFFHQFVPDLIWSKQNPTWWRTIVSAAFSKIHPAKNESEARKHFLTLAQKLPLYGHHFFDIKSTSDRRLPNGGILCINYQGIKIMDPLTRIIAMSFSYDTVVNFRYDDVEFVIKTGDLMTKQMMRLATREGFVIADLIQAYIQAHVNSRAKKDVSGTKSPTSPSSLS